MITRSEARSEAGEPLPGTDPARVRLRVTVIDPARVGARVDLELDVAAGERLGAVRGRLLAAVGVSGATAAGSSDGAGGAEGAGSADGGNAGRCGTAVQGVRLSVDGVRIGDDALLGLPPLLNGCVLLAEATPAPLLDGVRRPADELHVIAGPDPGGRFPIGRGGCVIGRAVGAQVRVDDPELSRLHAEVIIGSRAAGAGGQAGTGGQAGSGGARLRDLNSANGTYLDGNRIGSGWVPLRPGSTIQVGRSTLRIRRCGEPAAAVHPDGRGHLLVNRTPRLRPPPPDVTITFPAAPPARERPGIPWAAALVPLLISVPAALLWRQPTFLLLAALSPLAAVGQHLADRISHRRRLTRDRAAHTRALAEAELALQAALDAEAAHRIDEHPDLAQVAATACGPLAGLWCRRPDDPDAFVVRLGLGRVTARVEVRDPPDPALGAPELDAVPVTLDLTTVRVIGLAGDRATTLALARSIMGQLVIGHPPGDLRLSIRSAATDRGDWSWAAWLPHLDDGPPGPQDPSTSRWLLVLDGAARLRRRPEIAGLLAGNGPPGVLCLCLDRSTARLPVECGATVWVTEGMATLRTRGAPERTVDPDLPGPRWATRLARDLAALQDSTPADLRSALPGSVRLLDLLARGGPDPLDPLAIRDLWRSPPHGAVAMLGVTGDGPWQVDLRRDGPHLLIGGTTGSGKSELLQALIAGLATSHSPDALSFLLIDYKGGAAFSRLAALPHVAGVLTDLDGALAHRALISLYAEVRRRERLLRSAGAPSHDEYTDACADTAAARHGLEPLARLIIVVDEFRVLADEVPELLDGLVRIAAVGRSLGINLVLATQRPGGAVTADMRANLNLRIALRVRDRVDSEDVIDAPDAAMLPGTVPGRGLARAGGGELVAFQGARVTGREEGRREPTVYRLRSDAARPATLVRDALLPWLQGDGPGDLVIRGRTGHPPGQGSGLEVGTDLDRIVEAVAATAADLTLTGQPPPWLAPLPPRVSRSDLDELTRPHRPDRHDCDHLTPMACDSASAHPDRPGPALVYALADLPEEQRRAPLAWNLSAGTQLAIVGGPGSGRTGLLTALVDAACDLARGNTSPPVHVHAVDGRGGLTVIEGLDVVGTLVPAADVERSQRLLSWLAGEVTRRRVTGSPAGEQTPPWLVLIVDGWEEVADAWTAVDHGRLVDDLLRLVRDGGAAGLRVAISGGRGLLVGSPAALLDERLLLRSNDPMDLVLAGVPANRLPPDMPPGRLLRVRSSEVVIEAQVLSGAGLQEREGRTPARRCPVRLAALPEHLPLTGDLPPGSPSSPVIGLTAADPELPAGSLPPRQDTRPRHPGGLEPAELDLPFPGVLVAGVPGSGRSTALYVIGHALRASGRAVLVLAPPGTPPARLSGHGAHVLAGVPASDVLMTALATAGPDAAVLVDDAQRLEGTPAEAALLAAIGSGVVTGGAAGAGRVVGPSGIRLVLGTGSAEAALSFRGLIPRLRATRTGLLLGATGPTDGEVFGSPLPGRSAGPPGRGLMLRGGRACGVQVADPGPGPT